MEIPRHWNHLEAESESAACDVVSGSEEEFISEHYWGYNRLNEKKTTEYQVEHPGWRIHCISRYSVYCDFKLLYGDEFEFLTKEKPVSAFLATGSEIQIRKGTVIGS